MIVRVSRRRWGTGSLLNRNNNKMCCLGFMCRQAGVPRKSICNLGMPNALAYTNSKWGDLLRTLKLTTKDSQNSAFARRAAIINDNAVMSRPKKEKRLRALFKRYGHKIVFVP